MMIYIYIYKPKKEIVSLFYHMVTLIISNYYLITIYLLMGMGKINIGELCILIIAGERGFVAIRMLRCNGHRVRWTIRTASNRLDCNL